MRTRSASVIFLCSLLLSFRPARAEPAAAEVAKFFGDYFLGKALDQVWDQTTGQPDVRELDSRLRAFEAALSQVDQNLAQAIGSLRKDLARRPTRKEVDNIVRQV